MEQLIAKPSIVPLLKRANENGYSRIACNLELISYNFQPHPFSSCRKYSDRLISAQSNGFSSSSKWHWYGKLFFLLDRTN